MDQNNFQDNYYSYNEKNGFSAPPPQIPARTEPIKKKRSRTKIAICAVAGVLAVAIVSVSSIGGYVMLTGGNGFAPASTTVEWHNGNGSGSTSSDESPSQLSGNTGRIEMSTEDIYEKYAHAVVKIAAEYPYMTSTAISSATGIIMNTDGYILTNAHVVSENSDGKGISVQLLDDRKFDAKLVGYDTISDIAVIKIDAPDLVAAVFGNSDECRVGERAVAIGNPVLSELSFTLTQGTISAINRNITIQGRKMTVLQTDAAINPGNSGGPLFNKYGEVIGITSAKVLSSMVSSEGLGFAIPSNAAVTLAKSIIENGYVTGRPFMGITAETITNEMAEYYGTPCGAYVRFITPDSSASQSELLPGDIITAFNGNKVSSREELATERDKCSAGDEVTLTIYRDSKTMDIKFTLGENTNQN